MGSLFLPLDEWLPGPLAAAGLPAPVFYDGWQTRARRSGGFDPPGPWCVMWHHTASSPSTTPAGEAQWMCHTSSDRPLCNVFIERGTGRVWVLAAGRTNTNGSGGPVRVTRGTITTMNDFGFGMELANTGVGEPYAQAQIDAAFVVSNTINARAGNTPGDVFGHQQWAPTRKIDPATAAAVQGPWRPRSSTSSGTWNLDDLVAECRRRATTPPTPEVPDMTDDQARQLQQILDGVVSIQSNIWGTDAPSGPPFDQAIYGRLDRIEDVTNRTFSASVDTNRNIWGDPPSIPLEASILGRLEAIERTLGIDC